MSLKRTQTKTADGLEFLRFSQEKERLGCSESVSNLVSGLLLGRERLLLPTPRLAVTPHSFRDRIMSSSKSELSELSAEKETCRLCLVCGRTQLSGLLSKATHS